MTAFVERQALLSGPGQIASETMQAHPLRPGELAVRPDAVGICGTDLELLTGSMPYLASGFSTYPIRPGHEWTGIVTDFADDVNGFAIGDRVVGECSIGCDDCPTCRSGSYHLCPRRRETGIAGRPGALATWMTFPSANAHLIPAGVAAADAALVEPLAVALRGLERSDIAEGRTLGIVGAGTIGLLCGLAARARGVRRITVVEVDASRRQFAASLGFEVTAERADQAHHVVEASGSAHGIATAIDLCADGGTLVLLGLTGRRHVDLDVDKLVIGDITVRGSLGSPHVWPAAIDLIATRAVRPSVLVSHEYSLDDSATAFALAGHDPGARKVLIRPTSIRSRPDR